MLVDIGVTKARRILDLIGNVEELRGELAGLESEIKRHKGPVPPAMSSAIYGSIAKADYARDDFAGAFTGLLEDAEAAL